MDMFSGFFGAKPSVSNRSPPPVASELPDPAVVNQVVVAAPLHQRKAKRQSNVDQGSATTPSLSLASRLDYSSGPAGAECAIVGLASLLAQEQESESVRNPIDIVIVLDKSGSMAGEKLELCKRTLEFLIESGLTENDYLAVVAFDSSVEVVYPGGMMTRENKDILLAKISRLTDGSATNLSGGLFAGLKILEIASTAEVSAVCLLTDGMMNGGITDRNALASLTRDHIAKFAEGKAKPTVFTFGYGTDADTQTLKVISEVTGGTTYTIHNPESVPISFADCLGGLTAVAAQNIELTIEVTGNGAEFLGDPLTKFPFEKRSSSLCVVKIKDIYCGERRDLAFKVRLPKTESVTSSFVNITCKFIDTIHEKLQSISTTSEITRYQGSVAKITLPDAEVCRHLARLEAVQALLQARQSAEKGAVGEGKSRIEATIQKTVETLKALNINENEDAMIGEVLADLRDASKNMVSQAQFTKVGYSMMTSAEQSHGYQRSNKVDCLMDVGAEEHSAYANASKKMMMKSAKSAFGIS